MACDYGNVQTFDILNSFFCDNSNQAITASNMRDFLISVWNMTPELLVQQGSSSEAPYATTNLIFDGSVGFVVSSVDGFTEVTLDPVPIGPIGQAIHGGLIQS